MSGSADNDQKNGLTSSKRACLELMRIAEGDYSTQIKPRSDKDELGVALFKMIETLRDVATVSQALAVGDYTQKITIKGKDDKLGIAINQMVDSFRDIVHQANKISGGDYSAKIKPRSDKDELGVALFKMTETLRDVANVSQALAVGDYTQKITIKGKDDKLGVAINQMVDSFRSIVHQANKISGGDYSAKIKPRSDKDELGVALFKMTEDLKKLVKKLDQLAYFDPLTHSYTRHYFNAILEKTCAIAARHHRQFAILMLDIDDFKQVNDSFGHDVGDRLLVEFTERLKRNTRDSDFIVRMGGDEFSIIMTEISNDKEAGKLAKQLIRVLSEPYNLGSYCINSSTSIGIACYPAASIHKRVLLKNVDIALYKAKSKGKNTFQYFTEKLNKEQQKKARIELALNDAIQKGELQLSYQPRINILTGEVVGLEVLVELYLKTLGKISPKVFIPIAEESGLIEKIGLSAVSKACDQFSQWKEKYQIKDSFLLAFSVSPYQLKIRQFRNKVIKVIQESKVPIESIEFELMESTFLGRGDQREKSLIELSNDNVHFSIDYGGANCLSLLHLAQLPIEILKISQPLISEIGKNKEGERIVSAVIAIARSLELEAIAKGVETQEQANFLKKHGYLYAQGNYYYKPAQAGDIEKACW